MPAALPLSSQISQTSQQERNYKVIAIQYGNGYTQRAADGYNSVQDAWTVDWENINSTDNTTLLAAFDAAKGADYFTWTAPGDGASKKWIVTKVTRRSMSGSVFSVSASLVQVFDL